MSPARKRRDHRARARQAVQREAAKLNRRKRECESVMIMPEWACPDAATMRDVTPRIRLEEPPQCSPTSSTA